MVQSLVALMVFLGGFGQAVWCQDQPPPEGNTNEPEVVLTELAQLPYPPIARAARIMGVVIVAVSIGQDGTVTSATILSGPPMLGMAALQSAKESKFECRHCEAEGAQYTIAYDFRLTDAEPARLDTSQHLPRGPGRVGENPQRGWVDRRTGTLTTTLQSIRSIKCLWLWKCSGREMR